MNTDESKTRTELLNELKESQQRLVQAEAVGKGLKREAEKSAHLASFPELNPNPVLELDQKGNIKYINPATIRLFPDLATLGTKHPFLADWAQVVKEIQSGNWSKTVVREVVVESSVYEQIVSPGVENQIHIYACNITERKITERKLQESLDKFQSLVETTSDFIWEMDTHGVYTYCSPQIERLWGLNPEEMLGKTPFDLLPPEDREQAIKAFSALLETQAPFTNMETSSFDGTGQVRFLEISGVPFYDTAGKPCGYRGITRDITERKQTQDNLKVSETKYRTLFEVLPLGVTISDTVGNIIESNAEAVRLLGLPAEEHTKRHIDGKEWQLVRTGGSPMPADEYASVRALKENRLVENVEMGIMKAENEITWINVTAAPIPLPTYGVAIVYSDITERKQAEEMLLEAKEFSSNLITSARDGISVLDNHGVTIDVNSALCEMTGFLREELIGVGPPHPYWPPEQYEEINRNFQKTMAADFTDVEMTFMRKNGERFPVIVGPSSVTDKHGNVINYFATVKDITERKQAEAALRESEAKYRTLTENSLTGIFIMQNEKQVYANNRFAQMHGYKSGEEIVGMNYLATIPPDNREFVRQSAAKRLKGKADPQHYEAKRLRKDGETFWAETIVTTIEYEGKPAIMGNIIDITERKRMEQSLEKERQEIKLIIDSSPIIVFYKDREGRFLSVNKAFAEALKMPEEEFLGKTVFDLYSAEIAQGMMKDDQEVLKSGRPKLNRIEQYESASGIRWVQTDKIPIFDQNGIPAGLIGFAQDVTERKQMAEVLLLSEQNFRDSIGNLPLGIRIVDEDGKALYANQALLDIYGYSSLEELEAVPSKQRYTPESYAEHRKRVKKRKLGEHVPPNYEISIVRNDGQVRELAVSRREVLWDGEKQFQMVYQNITERKQSEELVLRSRQELRNLSRRLQTLREEERAVVAREIHDELGQALTALIIDLAWLSKRLPEDNEALLDKTESMSKLIVATMQAVRRISANLRPEMLDDLGLVLAIEWLAGEFRGRTGIKLRVTIEPKDVGVQKDLATAIFRIFQETLTNIARHAQATRVTVSLREKAGMLALRVKDNGLGIMQEKMTSPQSIGIIGMRERVFALGGEVEMKGVPGKGTTVIVRIPVRGGGGGSKI